MNRFIITYEIGIYENKYTQSYSVFAESKDEIKEKFIESIDEWKSRYPDYIKPDDRYLVIDSEHFMSCEDTWPKILTSDIIDSFRILTLDEFFEANRPHKDEIKQQKEFLQWKY